MPPQSTHQQPIPDAHEAFHSPLHPRHDLSAPDLQGALSSPLAHALQTHGVMAVQLNCDLYEPYTTPQDFGYPDKAAAKADGFDLRTAHLVASSFHAWDRSRALMRATPDLQRLLLPILEHLSSHWALKKRWLPPRTATVRLEWAISQGVASLQAIGHPQQVTCKRTRPLSHHHISRNMLPERVANFMAALQQLATDGVARVDMDLPNQSGDSGGEPEFDVVDTC